MPYSQPNFKFVPSIRDYNFKLKKAEGQTSLLLLHSNATLIL